VDDKLIGISQGNKIPFIPLSLSLSLISHLSNNRELIHPDESGEAVKGRDAESK